MVLPSKRSVANPGSAEVCATNSDKIESIPNISYNTSRPEKINIKSIRIYSNKI